MDLGRAYYRARYYDSKVGRLISEDPAGFYFGLNFYHYAFNNPINLIDPNGLCATDDTKDACHAQLSYRMGAVGEQLGVPHMWWWISIGNQDWIISGTGFNLDAINGITLGVFAWPGTQSQSNPGDRLGNGTVVFDTRDWHGGFASPDDCYKVREMLYRAQHFPNGLIPYDWEYTSNAGAYYVGWPFAAQITPPNKAWGWGVFLPGLDYPNYR